MLDVFQRQEVAANLVKCERISGLKGNTHRPTVDQILENQYQLKMSACHKKSQNKQQHFVFWHFCSYHCCLEGSMRLGREGGSSKCEHLRTEGRGILISHYLPVKTHHNNFRATLSSFFDESKETQSKLHGIILILLQLV